MLTFSRTGCHIARLVCFGLACLSFALKPAAAETRALLVGVSEYDNDIGLADLRGPKNDVVLLNTVLRERGVTDIIVLADGVDGAKAPTRSAIMDALEGLKTRSVNGDLVIVHLSGHGTRQIDRSGDEADGYDEIFLPSDVARAENGQIPNAIIDEEIGTIVHALRRNGVDVWTIMDFCHAGTGLRSGSTHSASRFADPQALGLNVSPAPVMSDASPREFAPSDDETNLPGGLIAFYAARASEVAREVDFGRETGGEEGWYGLFTSKIAARLQSSSGITYGQLFQGVLDDMRTGHVPGGSQLQTPQREGTLSDALVLGGSATLGVQQFAVDFDEVAAGRVHGLEVGTVLGLVADATAAKDEIIGYAQVEDARPATAFVRPVSDQCIPDQNQLCVLTGTMPEGAKYARIVAVSNSFTLRLSPVLQIADGQKVAAADSPLVRAYEDAIAGLASGGMLIELSQDNYAVQAGLHEDRLWFGPEIALGDTPIGLSWSAYDGELEPLLERIAAAERFAATMNTIAASASILSPTPIEAVLEVEQSEPGMLTSETGQMAPRRECQRIEQRQAYGAAIAVEPGQGVKQCDRLRVVARGEVPDNYDVNRIYIDAHYCMTAQHRPVDGIVNAIPVGGSLLACSDCPGGYSAGMERMFVLVSKARANAEQLNLSSFVDNCVELTATRGAGATALNDLLTTFGKPPGTRGSMGGMAPQDVWVKRFDWTVLPREIALAPYQAAQRQ